MRSIPMAFLARMKTILGDQYAAFAQQLEFGERQYAIRVNSLKLSREGLLELLPSINFEAVPWSETGLYAPWEARLGSHALHHAGAFYVQEASAQAVAAALEVKAGSRVLDLCAAPGGKSTHLAALMQNQGMLVCNEIHPTRAKALAENLERLGCIGAVTNEEPARLAQKWGAVFDFVLVDAPCSGEGMFRKHDAALEAWSEAHVSACAVRQSSILEDAAKLLADGGVLLYSTCTFAPEENEQVIEQFLAQHPEFSLEVIQGFTRGLGGIGSRLLPHQLRGEGHFLARLRKSGRGEEVSRRSSQSYNSKLWTEFKQEFNLPVGQPLEFRGKIEMVSYDAPSFDGLKALRIGTRVAQIEKNRLEPHHALSRVQPHVNVLELEPSEVGAYLRGETITRAGEAGWVLLTTQGFGLGWGKRVGSTIKNHYPKHLRGQTIAFED